MPRMLKLLAAAVARHYLRKPDLAEFLATRLPDAGALLAAARNEAAFLIGAARLPRLAQLNVELTSRCNVACSYCDVNRGLRRGARDLDPAVVARLVESTPTLRTLLPFQWGEPLLYPALDEVLAHASRRGVRSFLTTNGTLLDGERLARLSDAGLSRLTVSLDGGEASHATRRGYAQAPVLARLADARAAQARLRLPVRLDVSMVVDESVAGELGAFRARLSPLCDRVQFIPRLRAGRRTRACREPWRGALVVLSDGRVTACCADAQGALALGRIDLHGGARGPTPPQLYASPAFVALRRDQRRKRFRSPCAGCDECAVPGVSRRFA
jgi:sulfatase maturation enzyme AslB (radical SAM superfamily)